MRCRAKSNIKSIATHQNKRFSDAIIWCEIDLYSTVLREGELNQIDSIRVAFRMKVDIKWNSVL